MNAIDRVINHECRCIFVHIPKTGGTSIGKALNPSGTAPHVPIRNIQMLAPTEFESYFKFAFFRHPLDRLVSNWFYRTKTMDHRIDTPSFEEKTFEDLCRNLPTSATLQKWLHHKTQLSWISDLHGAILVDQVFTFDRLQTEWKNLALLLGAQRQELPHLRKSLRRPWQEMYTNETNKIVSDFYHDDVVFYEELIKNNHRYKCNGK